MLKVGNYSVFGVGLELGMTVLRRDDSCVIGYNGDGVGGVVVLEV